MLTPEHIKILRFWINRYPNTFPLEAAVIPYMDLTILLSGEMEYYINGTYVKLQSGDAILFPPGSTRERLFNNTPVHYASINLELHTPIDFPATGHIPKCVRTDTEYFLESLLKEINSVSLHKEEKCCALFSYLFYQVTETACDKEDARIKTIKQYVIQNLARKITLEEIANMVHLAPNYCSSYFKKETGISLMQFILQERLDFAKRLLITKDLPLSKIAEKCGFEDYIYFSHAFKKQVGMSPSQYKDRKIQKMLEGQL